MCLNVFTLRHRSTLCLFPLGYVPFTYGTSSIFCCLQDTLFNSVMGTYLGIKHYPHISLTFYNCVYWVLYATNYTLPECLLLFHYCLHTFKHDIFCEGRGVHICQYFSCTSVVELLDSTTTCMSINNTLAKIVCCCFS